MRISDWSSDVCSSDLSDVALLFLDLDGFKEVNDEHGHGVGDELLVTTADRLAAGSPDEALVARLGGDEFVVCAAVKKVPEAVALAHRLAGLVSGPVRLPRSEEHTSELQSLMRISYAVFCLKKKKTKST